MRTEPRACDDVRVMSATDHALPRRATRDAEAAVVGGVAAGLARHLGVSVLWVRAAFVAATLLSGLGVLVYAALWSVLPADRGADDTPGGEAAERRGLRAPRVRRLGDVGPAVALLALGAGALLLLAALVGSGVMLWGIAAGVAGVALLWRQADEAQRERWLDASGALDPVRMIFGQGGWAAYLRVAAGVVLLLTAAGVFVVRGDLAAAPELLLAAGLAALGVGIVLGPWIHRLVTELGAERAERIRTQERADVAAHLHDSVLQTLALIQRNASDPAAVVRLARGQERDLRGWLYDAAPAGDATLAVALKQAAAESEDSFGIAVDTVVVGDAPLDERLRALLAAAREALVNVGKHAGVTQASLYAEIGPGSAEVFVRDRGAGFVPAAVPDDRHGIRDSITGRMERHGGSVTIRSGPGEGTEVRLRMDT